MIGHKTWSHDLIAWADIGLKLCYSSGPADSSVTIIWVFKKNITFHMNPLTQCIHHWFEGYSVAKLKKINTGVADSGHSKGLGSVLSLRFDYKLIFFPPSLHITGLELWGVNYKLISLHHFTEMVSGGENDLSLFLSLPHNLIIESATEYLGPLLDFHLMMVLTLNILLEDVDRWRQQKYTYTGSDLIWNTKRCVQKND